MSVDNNEQYKSKVKEAYQKIVNSTSAKSKDEVEKLTKNEKVMDQFTKDMFITKEVEDLLNKRIELEYHNSQGYHALSVCADKKGLLGLKELMHKQGEDEHGHATRIISYITDMGGTAIIPKVDQMTFDFKAIDEYLSKALDLEIETTKQYTILYKQLFEIGDFLTLEFISWFLGEQREELELFRTLLDRWESVGKTNPLVFDKELKEYV